MKIFGGGPGHGQERLSPEPARSVKVRAKKEREIRILSVFALYRGQSLHLNSGPPDVERGVWGDFPPILGQNWPLGDERGVWGDFPPHSRAKPAPW